MHTELSTCTLASSHPLNEWITTHQNTQHCSLHSLLHKRQPICANFNSNKSPQKTHTPTCCTNTALLMDYTSQSTVAANSFVVLHACMRFVFVHSWLSRGCLCFPKLGMLHSKPQITKGIFMTSLVSRPVR